MERDKYLHDAFTIPLAPFGEDVMSKYVFQARELCVVQNGLGWARFVMMFWKLLSTDTAGVKYK